jgi:hypothetical protein
MEFFCFSSALDDLLVRLELELDELEELEELEDSFLGESLSDSVLGESLLLFLAEDIELADELVEVFFLFSAKSIVYVGFFITSRKIILKELTA